jgi:hypothetical protein
MQQLAGRDAEDPWTPVLQNVIQTGYQALAVGVLGGLAKLWLDGRSRRNAAQAELRQRRSDLIRRLVAASHSVDASRLIISANRSVKSWTEQTNLSLIPARTEIKSISHDLANWKSANLPMFSETSAVQARLDEMTNYLTELIEEYSEEKSALSELQRTAGTNDAEREQLLGQIWRRMRTLHHLGDYLLGGDGYGEYRHDYIESLRIMRAELASFDRLVAGMR